MRSKESYYEEFSSLKRNHQFKKPSPHKIIYYLAIIDAIVAGFIDSHRFLFIPQLHSRFIENWEKYVGNEETYRANIYQPAFYSDSSSFYSLIPLSGKEKKVWCSEKSFSNNYECIEIDPELFSYIKNDKTFAARLRIILVSSLL